MAEVFGYPINCQSDEAKRYRKSKLCPFNNKVPNCTKDKAKNPLGVCSVFDGNQVVSTCPVRFREDWLIASDAAEFFFSPDDQWTTLTEIRLKDGNGKSAGNIDVVLVSYDANGKIKDFGALEVQAVYISGNVRNPFEAYIRNADANGNLDWRKEENYPSPDFLSSSRKRLAPQLLYKGGILVGWEKKTAVALDLAFWKTLPNLAEVPKEQAEMAWFIYDWVANGEGYKIKKHKVVYTKFSTALNTITYSKAGNVADFIAHLQEKLDEKLETEPDTEDLKKTLKL